MNKLRYKLRRLLCYLFGCYTDDVPACDRCGEELYGGEFIEHGLLDGPRWRWWRWLRRRICGLKCDVCNRRYWFGGNDWVCSDECMKKWIPF